MATGDVTISVAVAGGVTKSVVLDSATRVLCRAVAQEDDAAIDTDAEWQVLIVNRLGRSVLGIANRKLESEASWTPKSFTAAT
jgi:hypothetical protein